MAKQYFGLERVLGGIFYTRGSFSNTADYLWLLESQDMANGSIYAARQLSGLVDEIYRTNFKGNETYETTINEMRFQLREEGNKIESDI